MLGATIVVAARMIAAFRAAQHGTLMLADASTLRSSERSSAANAYLEAASVCNGDASSNGAARMASGVREALRIVATFQR